MNWFTALLRYLAPPKQTVDPNCKRCYGVGYDVSGHTCACVRTIK